MRGLIDVLRWLLGIHPYTPGVYPHARRRMPTWYGARRRNGHGDEYAAHPLVDGLVREHRSIRQLIIDAAKRRRP